MSFPATSTGRRPRLQHYGAMKARCDAAAEAAMLYGIKGAFVIDAHFTWVDKDFLEARKIAPWSQLPACVPPEGEYVGFHFVSVKKAVVAGLSFRPLTETARDTVLWFKSLGEERHKKMGASLAPGLERELFTAWPAREVAPPA